MPALAMDLVLLKDMSSTQGDKARFGRQRNRKLARRERMRKLREEMGIKATDAGKAPAEAKSA
jgi:hypothetical protein